MAREHALSGVVVGLATAPVVLVAVAAAATVGNEIAFAMVVAAFALAPDLDCGPATASRSLGPITGALSKLLQCGSRVATRLTETDHDRHGSGVHRHLTHTLVFAVVTGAIAAGTSLLSPWVVCGWLAIAALWAQAASMLPHWTPKLVRLLLPKQVEGMACDVLRVWPFVVLGAVVLIPAEVDHTPVAATLAGMQSWLGYAVALGCLVHLAGDAITVSGVPACWPFRITGQAWHEVHLLPEHIRLHTGKRFEKGILYPLFLVGAAATALLTFPGLLDQFATLIQHPPQLATALQKGHF